jgi:hypothetical protein
MLRLGVTINERASANKEEKTLPTMCHKGSFSTRGGREKCQKNLLKAVSQ